MRRPAYNPALKRATCAALIAATFAIPVSAETVHSIERYCTTSWRQAGIPIQDWEDCTQDTLLELLSRLPQQRVSQAIEKPKSDERRELMRSVWCVAQRWRRGSQRQAVSLDLVADCETQDSSKDWDFADGELVNAALDSLGETQRNILRLWGDGNSVAEISAQLDMPPARVSDQKYKAIRSLKAKLATEVV